MTTNYTYALVLILLMLSSCRDTGLNFATYSKYVQANENGLRKSLVSDSLLIEMQYVTTDMMCHNALRSNPSQPLSNLKDEYGNNHNVLMKIKNIHNFDLGTYLNFEFENDIRWICNFDTLRPVLYHHENLSSLNQTHHIVLAFDKHENELCDFNITITPNSIVRSKVDVVFEQESITNIPNLKFNL
ncbi:MAG: hypothetical protein P1U56_01840 [Saprospiraceae bacterium]|nr:hypothetical protein [Saprospiraceae bacterium]